MSTRLLTVCFVCISSTDICEHKGRTGKKWSLLHISGEDRAYKGIFFFYGLLIRCLKLGLNSTPKRQFHGLAASCVYSAELRYFTFKKQNSQQKFSWRHCVKPSYSSCDWELSNRCWRKFFLFTFDHLWVRTVWDPQRILLAAATVAATRDIM